MESRCFSCNTQALEEFGLIFITIKQPFSQRIIDATKAYRIQQQVRNIRVKI